MLNIVTCDRGVGRRTPLFEKKNCDTFFVTVLFVSFRVNNHSLYTIYFISVILIFFAKFFTSAGINTVILLNEFGYQNVKIIYFY
ncbi:hypothetical protein CUM69_02195 [Enterococcus faecium]|nr:hypothetical protein [Enterococcus faecium]EGP5632091.1 hypothetical protein [Enterococcus faecium]PQC82336.1 hypothetical protein CUM69_02195 [Enterococcus faecium]